MEEELKEVQSEIISTEKELQNVSDLAENVIGNLTENIVEPMKNVENALKTIGTSTEVVKDLVSGGLDNINSNVLGLASSVLPIDELKNKPSLQLKSLALNLSPKIKKLHGSLGNIVNNVGEGLNISMNDIANSTIFQNALSEIGVDPNILDDIDLTNMNLDGLKNTLAEKTGIKDIGEKLTDVIGTPDALINNFAPDKLGKKALSLVTNSGAKNSMDLLKRFMS